MIGGSIILSNNRKQNLETRSIAEILSSKQLWLKNSFNVSKNSFNVSKTVQHFTTKTIRNTIVYK